MRRPSLATLAGLAAAALALGACDMHHGYDDGYGRHSAYNDRYDHRGDERYGARAATSGHGMIVVATTGMIAAATSAATPMVAASSTKSRGQVPWPRTKREGRPRGALLASSDRQVSSPLPVAEPGIDEIGDKPHRERAHQNEEKNPARFGGALGRLAHAEDDGDQCEHDKSATPCQHVYLLPRIQRLPDVIHR